MKTLYIHNLIILFLLILKLIKRRYLLYIFFCQSLIYIFQYFQLINLKYIYNINSSEKIYVYFYISKYILC